MGEVDIDLQVHNKLMLCLRGVKVQEVELYQILLGSDVLRGTNGVLGGTSVNTGDNVLWRDTRNGVTYETKVLNPCGPVGVSHMVMGTSDGTTTQSAAAPPRTSALGAT